MPTCANCGSHVSQRYVAVREPEHVDQPRACPKCPDKIHDGPDVRETKAARNTGATNGGATR